VTSRADFAYVQARVQARHGRLADAPLWRALQASRSAAHYLARLRASVLADWVDALADTRDPHRIERQLRERWRGRVDEVARWQPARWRAATRWFATLGDLAPIDAMLQGSPVPRWAHDDSRLAAFAQPDPGSRADALGAAGLAPFAGAAAGGEGARRDAASIWLAEWARLVPAGEADPALLRRPAELLLPRLRGAGGGARALPAEATRHALRGLFRRHATTPVAVFAHLGLVALDAEQLRGEIVVRCLYGPGAGSAGGSAELAGDDAGAAAKAR